MHVKVVIILRVGRSVTYQPAQSSQGDATE
uniref:Uncharacterized protein n=1 Tax=Anguilla anguilla TaxID=7936 RepID=A0A0E9RJW7_ANGAN